jgi:hypothetical protein
MEPTVPVELLTKGGHERRSIVRPTVIVFSGQENARIEEATIFQAGKRIGAPLRVFLDNNIFDLLYDMLRAGEDLDVHLPADEFALFITGEVWIEVLNIPLTTDEQREKKPFFLRLIKERPIKVYRVFGFADPARGDQERWGGFDSPSPWFETAWFETEAFSDVESAAQGKLRGSGLYQDEADAYLAARSRYEIVLTMEKMPPERKKSPGPLQFAYQNGRLIVSLASFDWTKQTLKDFIRSRMPSA